MSQSETTAPSPSGHGPPRAFTFLSDCHLCADDSPGDRARRERVIRFLHALDPRRDALYIVGDLFDFWFTYRSTIPRRGFEVMAQLWALRRDGMSITFVAGNHDYWAVPFLRDELAIEVVADRLERDLQGRRFLIAHGDGLGSGEWGYKILRRVLRNPVAIALYRLLHPDLGIALATASSRLSRHQGPSDESPHVDRLEREVARPAFAAGFEVAVFGHLHHPTLRQAGAHTMVVLGDWLRNFTYLRLEEGSLTLYRFGDDGESRMLAAEKGGDDSAVPAAATGSGSAGLPGFRSER